MKPKGYPKMPLDEHSQCPQLRFTNYKGKTVGVG